MVVIVNPPSGQQCEPVGLRVVLPTGQVIEASRAVYMPDGQAIEITPAFPTVFCDGFEK